MISAPPGAAALRGDPIADYDAPDDLAVVVPSGGTTPVGTVVYLRWGRIIGTVLDAAGHAVAGLTVRTNTGRTGITDVNGFYSIPAPKGSHSVSIDRKAGVVTPTGSQTATVVSATDTAIGFVANPYVGIGGMVTDGAGNAVTAPGTGARPVLSASDGYVGGTVLASFDADGKHFTILLPPGGATIYAQAVSGYSTPAPRTVRSEERRVGKECRIRCRSRWSPYH